MTHVKTKHMQRVPAASLKWHTSMPVNAIHASLIAQFHILFKINCDWPWLFILVL